MAKVAAKRKWVPDRYSKISLANKYNFLSANWDGGEQKLRSKFIDLLELFDIFAIDWISLSVEPSFAKVELNRKMTGALQQF